MRTSLPAPTLEVAASLDSTLADIVELPFSVHPYYPATQGHPELGPRRTQAHLLVSCLIKSALDCQENQ